MLIWSPDWFRRAKKRTRPIHPLVEKLETRSLLTTIVVTSLADYNLTDGKVTLREAIFAANNDTATELGDTGSGADTIVFDPSLTFSGPGTITASIVGDTSADRSMFGITSNITIVGPQGNNGITLDGANAMRHFYVSSTGSLTLDSLQLVNGRAEGGGFIQGIGLRRGSGGAAGLGGSIFNMGTLALLNSTISGNTAQGGSGGPSGTAGGGGGGQGLLTDSYNNNYGAGGHGGQTNGGAGGSAGPNGFSGSAGGFGGGGGGGGLAFVPNGTGGAGGAGGFGGGGGAGGYGGPPGASGGLGGSGGFGGGGGGGGGGALLGGGGGAGGMFGGAGGNGLSNLGGNNDLIGAGGGGAGLGGAIFNAAGTITVTNSTITNNSALGGSGNVGGAGVGGGVFNLNGSVTFRNATLAGNTVAAGAGGSPTADGGSVYTLGLDGTGVGSASGATILASNTIFANSTGSTNEVVSSNSAISASSTNNLITSSVVPANLNATITTTSTLALGSLQDNGGPTDTMVPGTGSVAINSGSNSAASGVTRDQRGFLRLFNTTVDIGAVETQSGSVVVDYNASSGALTVFGLQSGADGININTTSDNVVQINLTSGYSTIVLSGDANGGNFTLSGNSLSVSVKTGSGQAPISTFNVVMGGGDDALSFSLAASATGVGNVAIDMGTGSGDIVAVGSANINGEFLSYGGAVAVTPNATIATHGKLIDIVGFGISTARVGVAVQGGATINAGGGNVILSGTGSAISYNGSGVAINGSVQTTGSGSITITGTGGNGSGSGNSGVAIKSGGSVSAGSGGIGITGNGSGTNSFEFGVEISGGATIAATSTGAVTITGTAGANGTYNNYGVSIGNNGTQISAASGLITITGTGGGTAGGVLNSANRGVVIANGAKVTGGSGGVDITGNGRGTSSLEYGVFVASGATVSATTTGAISITGTGSATGTYSNSGVVLRDTNTLVTTQSGAITITGTGSGSPSHPNFGVSLSFGALVSTTGSAPVTVHGTITGTGSAGDAVSVTDANSAITTANGAVAIDGTSGTAVGSRGVVVLSGGRISAGGSGTLTVTGTVPATSSGDFGVTVAGSGAQLNTSGGKVTITANSNSAVGLNVNDGSIASGGGTIDINTNSVSLGIAGTINSGAALTTLKPYTTGTLIDLGGTDVVTGPTLTLGLSPTEMAAITAGTLVIGDATTGNITTSAAVSLTSVTQLELVTGGQIVDSSATGIDITVTRLGLTAATGIGVGDALETAVGNLEATTSTGGIFINNTGALSIGGVNNTLAGLRVTGASGGIDLQNTAGNVRITTGGDQVKAPGNVRVKTLTSGNIITANNLGFNFGSYSGSVSSTAGTLTLDAAGDIDLGETGVISFNGDVQSFGSMILTAAGNISLDDQASAQTVGSGSTITITAGGDVSMISTYADGSLIGTQNSSGGLVSIRTGAGGTFTADGGTSNPGVLGGAAGILVATDNMVLLDDLQCRSNGNVTLVTVTAGRPIDLGTETSGSLSLTDIEINQVNLGNALNIGDSNSGTITLSAAISPSRGTLNLVTRASVLSTTSSGTDITVTNLNITAPAGIGSSANPLKMDAIQVSTNSDGANGDQYLREANSVTVLNGSSLSAGAGNITLVAGTFQLSGSMNAGTVNNAGTLAGSGTVNGNLSSTSIISPNGSAAVGTITINGNAVLANTYNFNITGNAATAGVDYDRIIVNGTVDLSGLSPSFFTNGLGAIAPQTVITMVQNDAQDATNPTGFPDGSLSILGGNPLQLFNNGGTGNDLVLVQSSTPSTVYVDDSFAANAGQVIADADLGTTGNQAAVFGINAFTTIGAALAAASSSGTVVVNAGSYAEAASVTGTQTLRIGGTDLAQAVVINSLATVAGTTVNLSGTSSLTIGDSTDTAVEGVITGGGSLTKLGSGVVTISGNNSYSGSTNVSAGTLRITADNGLGTTDAGTTVVSGARLDLRNVDYTTTETVALQGGSLFNSNGTTTFAGDVTLAANSFISTSATLLDVTGAITGSFRFTKESTGTLRLSNTSNNFSSVSISGGTLQLGAAGVIPDLAAIVNSANFDLNGFDETVSFINGGGTVGNSQSTLATLTLGAGNSGAGNTINGAITGAINLVKIGSGVQYLGSANNTYTGTTTINNGILGITSTGTQALGAVGSGTIVNANGQLFLDGVAYVTAEPITINGGTLFFWNTNSLPCPITLSTATATVFSNLAGSQLTLNGIVDGDQGLNKTGDGTLILTADNTYTGSTTVSNGTVLVNGSLAAASAVQVNNRGTLGGSGTIHGTVNVASGGVVSPGNSPGVLNSGSVTFASGSTYRAQVDGSTSGTFDQLNVTGGVSLGGSTLDLSSTIASNIGQQIIIINNDDTDPVVGTFNGVAEGDILMLNGLTFRISYHGGADSNDVVLTEVSPPTEVSVTMTEDTSAAGVGGTIVYTITVTNGGPFDATATSLIDNFAAQIANATWTSTASGGATGNTASSSGDIGETLMLPVGASVVYTVTAHISGTASGTLKNIATVSQAGDQNPGNNTAEQDFLVADPVSIVAINDAAEPGTNGKFRVSQLAPTPHDTIVTYSINGTAVNGTDYTTLTGTVTIPAGSTSADIDVLVRNDLIVEPGETVIVTLTGFTQSDPGILLDTTPSNLTATVNLADDDTNVLTITAPTITETDSDQTATFTVTSPNGVQGGFDVAIFTTSGTAGSVDYQLVTTTVHFDGTAGETHQVSVTIKGDTLVEANETFSVVVGAVTGTSAEQIAAITTGAAATGTIINDDNATYTIGDATVTEGGDLSFTVSLSNPVDVDTTVNVMFADVTTAAGDFAHTTVPVTFLAGNNTAQVILVATVADSLVETNETLTASLALAVPSANGRLSNTTDTGTGTITNDDAAMYSISDATVTEGGDLSFTVSLSNPVDVDTTVNVSFIDGTTAANDFNHTPVPVTFLAGNNTAQVILVATVGDHIVEGDETFTAQLALAAPLTGGRLGNASDTGAGTILNDDSSMLTINSPTVVEGNGGTTQLVFTVSSSAAVQDGFTVAFTVAGITADGADYSVVTGSPLAFTGTAGESHTITINVNGDTLVEANESLSVTLGAVTAMTPVVPASIVSGAVGNGTIENDDTATFTIDGVTVSEDAGTLTFNLQTGNPLDIDVTVDVTFTSGSATGGGTDFVSTTQQITFLAGQTSSQVTVAISNDNLVEATENFFASLSTATPLAGHAVDLTDTGMGTITDNDTAIFTINNVTVSEADGSLIFDLVTDQALDIDVTIDVTFTNGLAASSDYSSTTQQITFLAGETSKQVIVGVNDDNTVEATENFFATLGTATPLGGRLVDLSDSGTGTITDNDSATFTINDVTASETDGSLVFDLVTDRPLDIDVTIDVTFTNGSATSGDYTSTTQRITFLAGETSRPVTVAITDDNIVEATESFSVGLGTSTSLGGRSISVSDTGTGTITDNDLATFTIDDITVSEGAGSLVFDLVTDKPLDIDVTIAVTFTSGSASGGGVDFTSTTQQITFLAGETSKQVSIAINDDAIVEATETFTATLSSSTVTGGRSVTVDDNATGTITDNDRATVSIARLNDGAESNASTNGKFRITQSALSSADTVISYTINGTATPGVGNDYVALTGTATIPAGQTTVDIDVLVLDDAVIESTETVIVTLTGFGTHDPDITLDVTEATVNISDNDKPAITSGASASVVENTPHTTVVLDVDADPIPLAPGHTLIYSLSGADADLFMVDSATGEIRFKASPDFDVPADQDGDNVYELTVTVTADTTPAQSTSQNLTISLTSVNDITPVFTNPAPTFEIAENSANGTVVGSVPATDGDRPAQTLTYSIVSGNLGGAFTINPATGQVTVASSTSLNFEQVAAFALTVQVTDSTPSALTADTIVTINVTNVVENPTITIPNAEGTYHLGSHPAFISPDAKYLYDDVATPNYEGAELRVSIISGRSRRDVLSIVEQGEKPGQINLRGRKLFLGSTQIGTLKGGRGRNADLVVTMNSSATSAAVDSLVRRLNFQAKDQVGTDRTVQIQVVNIAGVDSNLATREISVVP